MKTSYIVLAIVVIVLVVGGLLFVSNQSVKAPTQSTNSAATVQTSQSNPAASSSAAAPAATATPAPQHFTVNGNDQTADLKTITVAKGTPVTITFGADSGTTYHGGLDFRSSVVNTGTITPGSTKTISFTADHSFSFTPYWPSTNIAKPYTINVVVR